MGKRNSTKSVGGPRQTTSSKWDVRNCGYRPECNAYEWEVGRDGITHFLVQMDEFGGHIEVSPDPLVYPERRWKDCPGFSRDALDFCRPFMDVIFRITDEKKVQL